MTALPRYATSASPGARHELGAVSAMASQLGLTLMPWQRQVARVATEHAPDGRGWRYPIVVVTVPRQSGKTTLMHAVQLQRAISRDRHLVFYTAQTGKDASARWSDLATRVEDHPVLKVTATIRRAAGSSAIILPNGSRIAPFAPTPKSLHGYTPPLVMTDEAFAHTAEQGNALEGAIRPAQITIPDRQWWIVSTMGTAQSGWLHDWVDRGRESVDDPESPIAYFEWSLDPAGDPYDPAEWVRYHPAVGHTITIESLAEDAQSTPPGEWERAYCNRLTKSSDPLLDLAAWDSHAHPDEALPRPEGRVVGIGYDISADRSGGAVWTAWIDDARAVLHAYAAGPGIDWVAAAVDDARAAIPGAVVGACPDGPTRQVTDELVKRGIPTTTLTAADYATACGDLVHRAQAGDIAHDGSPALRAAIQVAVTRPRGEAWTYSQTHSAGSIAALRAATAALRLATVKPAPVQPAIYT